MAETYTTNMTLIKPNPANAASPQAGPLWAQNLNDNADILDTHNHTSGSGVQVPVAGLLINADLQMLNTPTHYGVGVASYFGYFAAGTSGSVTAPFGSTYVTAAGDLYYRSPGGTDILISTDSAIAPTGTGEFNGFYGNYAAAGPSAKYIAYANDGNSSYEFYGNLAGSTTPSDYNTVASVLALAYRSKYTTSTPAFLSFDPAITTWGGVPEGGWALKNAAAVGKGLTVSMDSTTGLVGGADGAYANAVVGIYNSTAYGSPGTWGFSVNRIESDGTLQGLAANPSDLWLVGAATSTPQVIGTHTAITTGTPVAGFGNRVAFLAGGAAWAGYGNALPTLRTQGALDSFFQSATTANGSGLRLRGAYAGTLSTTAGIEVVALSAGVDSIGLGGAATSASLATIYGTLAPDADNTRALGLGGAQFSSVFTRAVSATGSALALTGATITANGNTTVNGTITTTGAVTSASTVTGTKFYPTSTQMVGDDNVGGLFKGNQVLAWGKIDANGGTPLITADFGVTSIVLSSSVNFATYDITLDREVTANAVVIVCGGAPGDSATGVQMASGAMIGLSTVRVTTARFASSTSVQSSTDIDFNFVVVGEPG